MNVKTMYRVNRMLAASYVLFALALVAFAATCFIVFSDRYSAARISGDACFRSVLDAAPRTTGTEFTIIGIPAMIARVDRPLCVVVSGAAPDDGRGAAASAASGTTDKFVTVTPFLDGHKAAFAAVKIRAASVPQSVLIDFGSPADASTPVATFWRDVLSGGTKAGKRTLTLGLSRSTSDSPEVVWSNVVYRVYKVAALYWGAAFLLLFTSAVTLYSWQSSLLRDNDGKDVPPQAGLPAWKDFDEAQTAATAAQANKVDHGKLAVVQKTLDEQSRFGERYTGPFSLGKCQMAFWLMLVIGGYLYVWLGLGQYLHVINESTLILLGLNSATGLIASQLTTNTGARSKSFFADILNDGNGPQLQRLQVVVWTVILGTIFVWNIAYNFSFVAFDTNLLLLMGIAQATYIGFKPNEKPK